MTENHISMERKGGLNIALFQLLELQGHSTLKTFSQIQIILMVMKNNTALSLKKVPKFPSILNILTLNIMFLVSMIILKVNSLSKS